MGYGQRIEFGSDGGIRRRNGFVSEPMRLADVVVKPHAEYGIPVFHCHKLHAGITAATCAANYGANRYTSCTGCQVGKHHVAQQTGKSVDINHSTPRQTVPLAPCCVRCGKSSSTDTRSIGRVRFVNAGTVCVSCHNRGAEVRKGSNSKQATPKLWAGLRETTITFENAGVRRTEDIGLRSSRHECERWLAHVHPSSTLIEVLMGGSAVPPFAGEHPLYAGRELPDMVGPRKPEHFYPAIRKSVFSGVKPMKPLPVGVAVDEEGDEFGYRVPATKSIRPVSTRTPRLLQKTAEDTLADFGFGSAEDLPDFILWLTKEWPPFGLRTPSAQVAGSVGTTDSDQPVSEATDAIAEEVTQDIEPGDRDDVMYRDRLIADIAAEQGSSVERVALELGIFDPDHEDERASVAPAATHVKAAQAPKRLTGKQQRKTAKRAAREQRAADRAALDRLRHPTSIAATAKAYMVVLFETGVRT